MISSIASIVAFFIDVSAIDRSPESENSTPTLIASLLPPVVAAAFVAPVVADTPVEPHADRMLPTAVVPIAAAPARLRTSRRVGC